MLGYSSRSILLVIGVRYYINIQQYVTVSVICAISDCYYHGAEPAFSSSRPLLLSVPIPFPVAKRPPHIGLQQYGERRKVSGGGAQTDNALPVKLLIEAGSLIQAASSIEARDKRGFY